MSIHSLACLSPNSITPTLRQSPGQVRNKVANLPPTQIMKVHDTNHVADFHDLCPRQVCDFVVNWSQTVSPTFPVHCKELNSIRATQTGLLRTCHGVCRKHLDMSRWFVSQIHGSFSRIVCIRDFRDLCWRLPSKLHDFMICHRLSPQLS